MTEYDTKIAHKPEKLHEDIFTICLRLTKPDVHIDEIKLATEVYKVLAAQHQDGSLKDVMMTLGVGTREELLEAVRTFQLWRAENPEFAQPQEEDDDEDEKPDAQFREELSQSSINDTAMFVIDNVVKRSRLTNRYDVMERFCAVLEHRFGTGDKLDENLEKMHLATTKDVLQAIDIYFVMKDLYPDTVFGRKRMQSVWAPVFQECFSQEEVC